MNCTLFTPTVSIATMAATVAAIESILPTAPLQYLVAEGGKTYKVSEPVRWLADQVAADEAPILCNGDERSYVGLYVPVLLPGFVPGGGMLARIEVRIPWTPAFLERMFALIHALGPASASVWGEATPLDACATIVLEYVGYPPSPPPPGAPEHGGPLAHVTHPAMPARIGWINFWSAETCRLLGVTADDPRRARFYRVASCDGGGMALQLTGDPLDLTRPEHQAALDAAYEAFPVIHNARRAGSR